MLNAEFGMRNGRGRNVKVHAVPLGHLGRFERQALFQGCSQQVAGFFLAAQQVEIADVLAAGVYVPADFDTK